MAVPRAVSRSRCCHHLRARVRFGSPGVELFRGSGGAAAFFVTAFFVKSPEIEITLKSVRRRLTSKRNGNSGFYEK